MENVVKIQMKSNAANTNAKLCMVNLRDDLVKIYVLKKCTVYTGSKCETCLR